MHPLPYTYCIIDHVSLIWWVQRAIWSDAAWDYFTISLLPTSTSTSTSQTVNLNWKRLERLQVFHSSWSAPIGTSILREPSLQRREHWTTCHNPSSTHVYDSSITMNKLPPEVLANICQHLPPRDLKSFRLLLWNTRTAAERFLFRDLYVQFNLKSLERLENIALHAYFGKYVKSIDYDIRMVTSDSVGKGARYWLGRHALKGLNIDDREREREVSGPIGTGQAGEVLCGLHRVCVRYGLPDAWELWEGPAFPCVLEISMPPGDSVFLSRTEAKPKDT